MIPGVAIGYRVAFNIINILIVGFIILPIIAPVAVSFSSLPFLAFRPVGFSLEWYGKAMHNSEFLASVWLSLKLAAAATILSPYIPMLFMGEEFAAETPFYYFVSHSDENLIQGRPQTTSLSLPNSPKKLY